MMISTSIIPVLLCSGVVQHLLDITSRDERAPAEMKVDVAMIEHHL